MKIVFIGAPGSGKGTQAREFIDKHNFLQLSTGDLLRTSISNGTKLGLEAKTFMDQGKLVSDQIMIGLVEDFLRTHQNSSVIFDGFPRTVNQAESLKEILDKTSLAIDKVFYFKIDPQILIKRLTGRRTCSNCGEIYHIESKPTKVDLVCDLCGGLVVHRTDDKESVIVERLEQFEKNTGPTVEYYRSKNNLIEIDSSRSPEHVFEQIQNILSLKHNDRLQ